MAIASIDGIILVDGIGTGVPPTSGVTGVPSSSSGVDWHAIFNTGPTWSPAVIGDRLFIRADDHDTGYDFRPFVRLCYSTTSVGARPWYDVDRSLSEGIYLYSSDTSVLTIDHYEDLPGASGSKLGMGARLTGHKTGFTTLFARAYDNTTQVWLTDSIDVVVIGNSLFTDAQEAAIKAGAAVGQKFTIVWPDDTEVVIHDETDPDSTLTVDGKGERSYRGTNVSPMDRKALESTAYTISCSNKGNKFHPATSGGFFDDSGVEVDPTECRLIHEMFIDVSGTWESVYPAYYDGLITDIVYHGYGDSIAEVVTKEKSGANVLGVVFDETHGDTALNL